MRSGRWWAGIALMLVAATAIAGPRPSWIDVPPRHTADTLYFHHAWLTDTTPPETNYLGHVPFVTNATGNYTIELYTESYTNGNNTAGNIFGFSSNPTANFTVVPEPASAALGLLSMSLLLRRRR